MPGRQVPAHSGYVPHVLLTVGIACCLMLLSTGCQSILFTPLYLIYGNEVKPKHDLLLKGEKRVAVACRSMASNQYEMPNAPRDIARTVGALLHENIQNKKLTVVDYTKVDAWLDDCNNDFDNFVDLGRDKSINADIIIGIEIIGLQVRDPKSPYQLQGRAHLEVTAVDCKTGSTLLTETLLINDPPNGPIPSSGQSMEAAFRPSFLRVVSQQVAILFHKHDPNKTRRIDADSLEMLRFND